MPTLRPPKSADGCALVYMNEWDAYPAQWLRNLFPHASVDERSIADVRADDVRGATRAHFFAGIGGWEYALSLAGWPDDAPVWTGSCPCQPFSNAGLLRGTDDERHLWPEFLRLIRDCLPSVVFGEQVASRLGREWLSSVRADLESLGYAFGAADLCAEAVGAPQGRQRLFWGAASGSYRSRGPRLEPGRSAGEARPWGWRGEASVRQLSGAPFVAGDSWPQPLIRKVDDGVPGRVGRLRAYGNAIVPQVASTFIRCFAECI